MGPVHGAFFSSFSFLQGLPAPFQALPTFSQPLTAASKVFAFETIPALSQILTAAFEALLASSCSEVQRLGGPPSSLLGPPSGDDAAVIAPY